MKGLLGTCKVVPEKTSHQKIVTKKVLTFLLVWVDKSKCSFCV